MVAQSVKDRLWKEAERFSDEELKEGRTIATESRSCIPGYQFGFHTDGLFRGYETEEEVKEILKKEIETVGEIPCFEG